MSVVHGASQVGEGVQFQWRHQNDKGKGGSWQEDLAQLSGGQRSLVAIALLVAVSPQAVHDTHVRYVDLYWIVEGPGNPAYIQLHNHNLITTPEACPHKGLNRRSLHRVIDGCTLYT